MAARLHLPSHRSRSPRQALVDALEPRLMMTSIPTIATTGILPGLAVQNHPVTLSYAQLLTATGANDADGDTIGFHIVTVAPGTLLTLTHPGGNAAAVTPATAQAYVFPGDVLSWTPSLTAAGQVQAFTVRATDNTSFSANDSVLRANTPPIVTIATGINQTWESQAATWGHPGRVDLTRTGDLSQPLTVNLSITGTGTAFTSGSTANASFALVTLAGQVLGTRSGNNVTATATFPAGGGKISIYVEALENNTLNATTTAIINLIPAANTTVPSYVQGTGSNAATVFIIDSHPTVTIAPATAEATLRDGVTSPAFVITRTPAAGGILGSTVVALTYNKAFGSNEIAPPSSVVFAPGETSKTISTLARNNATAGTTTLTATLNAIGQTDQTRNAITAGTGTATVTITTQDDFPPRVTTPTVTRVSTVSGTLTFSYQQLLDLTGARLADGAAGALSLSVGTITTGTLQRIPTGSTTPVTVAAGQVLTPGDTLRWIAPATGRATTLTAFSLFARDGSILSTTGTVFRVTLF